MTQTMKLYYSPGACSLSPHIVLRELGLNFDLAKVTFDSGKASDGKDFTELNPKGYVPALALPTGELLTEGSVIIQYLADHYPDKGLIPRAGTMERYRCMETLNFIASELHKGFSPLFRDDLPAEAEVKLKESLTNTIQLVSDQLGTRQYFFGSHFSVCDAYLFTVLCWARYVEIDLSKWQNLTAYLARIGERPAVLAAMKSEGLLKS